MTIGTVAGANSRATMTIFVASSYDADVVGGFVKALPCAPIKSAALPMAL
jgi:hypothetical protein